MAITQVISPIPEAGHRGIDLRDDFVTKQEEYQDHQRDVMVGELNTLATQMNTARAEMNAEIAQGLSDTQDNVDITITKALEALNSALVAEQQADIALSVTNYQADYDVAITYSKGQTVTDDNNTFYISKVDSNLGNSLLDSNYWAPVLQTVVLGEINLTETDNSPLITTLNESTSKTIKIADYNSDYTYHFTSTNGLINGTSSATVTSSTFTYSSLDITDGLNTTDSISGYAQHTVFTSQVLNVTFNINYIPTVADTVVTFSFATDTENSQGFE